MAKIMLVDDDVDLILQNKLLIEKKGHQVIMANSGQEALLALKTNTPDLIVLDVMMEHSTAGFVFARELGQSHPGLPIILQSGDPEKPNWMGEPMATWNPIRAILEKPVKPDVLLATIDKELAAKR